MKKILSFILIFVVLINPASAESTLNEPLSFTPINMPAPFAYFGGDENARFIEAYSFKVGHIDFGLIRYFMEYFEFSNYQDLLSMWSGFPFDMSDFIRFTSIMDRPNNFSIIIANNIPNEVVMESIEKYNAIMKELYNPAVYEYSRYTEEDIAAIITRDIAIVVNHFVHEHSIAIDDKAFTPAWVYYHTLDDYKLVGITPNMIQERLHLYAEFPFADEATLAFEAKLSEFLGRDVVLENERVLTTSDALAVLRAVAGLTALTDAESARLGISGEATTADAIRILRSVAGLA